MTRGEKLGLLVALAALAGIAAPSIVDRYRPAFVVAKNEGPIMAVGFTPDGRHLVTRTYDHVSVYSTTDGSKVASRSEWLGHDRAEVHRCAIAPRGDLVACERRLYSLPALEVRGELPGDALAFAPDGQTIAVLTSCVRLVGTSGVEEARGIDTPAKHVSFSEDGTLIATCASWTLTQVFPTRTGAPVVDIATEEAIAIGFVGPRELAIATGYAEVSVYSADTGALLRRIVPRSEVRLGRGSPVAAVFAAGGAFAWSHRGLEVRSTIDGSLQWRRDGSTRALALSTDGSLMAEGNEGEHAVRIWRR